MTGCDPSTLVAKPREQFFPSNPFKTARETPRGLAIGRMHGHVDAPLSRDGKPRKRGACHLFRHTMATLMFENGADIRSIQQMLGHTRLADTDLYAGVDPPIKTDPLGDSSSSLPKPKPMLPATMPPRLNCSPL